jgi:hypothetical protein
VSAGDYRDTNKKWKLEFMSALLCTEILNSTAHKTRRSGVWKEY